MNLLANRGEYAEADEFIAESLAVLRTNPSPTHFRIIQMLEKRVILQSSLSSTDTLATVREIYEETHKFYPDDSPMLAMSALGYGRRLFMIGENLAMAPQRR